MLNLRVHSLRREHCCGFSTVPTISDESVGTLNKFSLPPLSNVENYRFFSLLIQINTIFFNIDLGGGGGGGGGGGLYMSQTQVSQLLLSEIVGSCMSRFVIFICNKSWRLSPEDCIFEPRYDVSQKTYLFCNLFLVKFSTKAVLF